MCLSMPNDGWLSPDEIRQVLIECQNDPLFGRRVMVATASLMCGKTFQGCPLGARIDPLGFIQTAMTKALSGERRMRVDESDDFLSFLIGCIQSEISNTVTGKQSSIVRLT